MSDTKVSHVLYFVDEATMHAMLTGSLRCWQANDGVPVMQCCMQGHRVVLPMILACEFIIDVVYCLDSSHVSHTCNLQGPGAFDSLESI